VDATPRRDHCAPPPARPGLAAPALVLRPAWDWSSILGDLPRWGGWRGHPRLDQHTRDLLARAAAHAESELLDDSSRRRRPTVGLIHADLRLGNILVDEDTLTLLDFDDCGPGYLLWDLATVFTGIEDDPRLDTAVHTWLDGYRAVTDLDPADIELIPTLIMLRRLQVLAWLVSHPDTDLAKTAIGPYTQTTTTLAERYLARRLVTARQR
jgi:Ser/Thr protein kinase RdoA (MazF antagonist)